MAESVGAVPVGAKPVVVRPVSIARRDPVTHDVGGDVVLEVTVARHAPREVEQAREGIIPLVLGGGAEGSIVPVIVADEPVEGQWVGRKDRHHGAGPVARIHEERVTVRAPPNLHFPAPAHEIVIGGVEGEQHANPSLGVGMQNDKVAVFGGLDVYAGAVTAGELFVIDFYANGGVVGLLSDGRTNQRQQQWQYHGGAS